ncbi:hypothetical protein [Aurantimonas sp. HBX-1]|uniref:hypothetical protein n=1 Tax=Aurantimonas sp. HBX-1 TaxID=2906072 RepID=UPI001F1D02EC|nr:hypothetical protein [Aurantimonas sp. HBX-1]UIJ71980.1 hypothetical protein LXB15_20265 [Aurantimonas sp. HBX-1]
MAVGLKAQKTLWGRAAGRCSLPECRAVVFEDDLLAGSPTLVGENCHIVSDSDIGPRANPNMRQIDRDSYPNLILCCRNHHRVIDAQTDKYTVDELHRIKFEHEQWVAHTLNIDRERLLSDETYAGYVENWEKLAHVNDWDVWTSHMLGSGIPSIFRDVDIDHDKLRRWLLARVWPGKSIELERAFINFRLILSDLHEVFHRHSVRRGDMLWTEQFYKIKSWDPDLYHSLHRKFLYHVDLVEDLVLELTRAGNLICERVRGAISPNYRLEEGHLVIESGPDMNFNFVRAVVSYSDDEKLLDMPYPGLEGFKIIRTNRDRYYGAGLEPIV